jgi:hypothetical protein
VILAAYELAAVTAAGSRSRLLLRSREAYFFFETALVTALVVLAAFLFLSFVF